MVFTPDQTSAHVPQLVAQRQDLQRRVAAEFRSGQGQTYQGNWPTDHAAEASGKWLGSPPFSDGMEFLPTTGCDHIVGDGSLREGDAELEQLAVNSGSAPQRIGAIHFPNQSDDGWGDGFSTCFARTVFPSPEETKPCSMPADDGAGLNQAKPAFRTIPDLGEPRPRGPIDWSQPWLAGTPAQDQ